MKEDVLLISTPADFRFDLNVDYLARSQNELLYRIEAGTVLKAIKSTDNTMVIRLTTDEEQAIHCHFLQTEKPLTLRDKQEVRAQISEWFDLTRDLSDFYQRLAEDPLLCILKEKYAGLRIMGIADFYEAMCWGIIGQQINLTFAYTLKRRFVETFGDFVQYQGEKYWFFPEAEQVAQASLKQLTDLKMSQKKAEYLLMISEKIVAGELSKAHFLAFPTMAEAEKELTKLRGIGPWTANYVSMRCFRFPEAFPMADIGLLNAVKSLKQMDRKPTNDELKALFQPFTQWEAYLTFYLWRILY